MSKEDTNITIGLQSLELGTSNASKIETKDSVTHNPFTRRKRSKSLTNVCTIFGSPCNCRKNLMKLNNTASFKHGTANKKILKDPVLKLVGKCSHVLSDLNLVLNCVKSADLNNKQFGQCSNLQNQDFRSIMKGCEQLSLVNTNDEIHDYSLPTFQCVRVQLNNNLQHIENHNVNNTCAHQARITVTQPCDVTIDELASYFETFVHIPRKMSSMAEMMYI